MLDYEAISKDFLRLLRGPRSQVAFSRRLRYQSNVSYTWESGRRWPTASTTLWAATRVGIDIPALFRLYLRAEPDWLGEELDFEQLVPAFLNHLRGRTPIGVLASRTGKSRFAVSRWLKGQTEPRLPDFFRMIECSSFRLLDFLRLFGDLEALPSVRAAWLKLEKGRRLYFEQPWSQAVLLALELEEYIQLPKHSDDWLATRLGISLDVVQECVQALVDTGQIRRKKKHYTIGEIMAVDMQSYAKDIAGLKQWWAQTAIEAHTQGAEGLFSYNVFTVSEEDFERLQELHRSTFRAMRTIISESMPGERLVLAHLSMQALD